MLFEDLVEFRADLRNFVPRHQRSIDRFYEEDRKWYRIHVPGESGAAAPGEQLPAPTKNVRHLTSTTTCLESLVEAVLGPDGDGDLRQVREQLTQFTQLAFENPQDWNSDGGALVYCRVRTLGGMARLARTPALREVAEHGRPTDWFAQSAGVLADLLRTAWESHGSGPVYGVREANTEVSIKDSEPETLATALEQLAAARQDDSRHNERNYPANAFLTYWALAAADELAAEGIAKQLWDQHAPPAIAWVDAEMAHQTSYHSVGSPHADPQQLAWAICAFVRFTGAAKFRSKTTTEYARLTAALATLFDQQRDDGSWAQGKPLFHYPNVGNAYCYAYETLGELLHLATSGHDAAAVLRESLRPYAGHLRRLFELAKRQEQRIDPGCLGWSSGHHAHRTAAESWATASVFRFAQMTRKLVGHWASLEAQAKLRASLPLDSRGVLAKRGATWDLGSGSMGLLLSTTFLNPVRLNEDERSRGLHPHAKQAPFSDPDIPVVRDSDSRSAMLFGPPGTGKTTLIKAIAAEMNWPFVEITPAQFLDEGVDLASKRADKIFSQVMELDRCVVLLDEIDELIKIRDNESSPVERFFTTSMLPRLAKLWDGGKVLFFVNTNDVVNVDPAIRRSQRFDAALLVLPPGYESKTDMIREAGGEWPFTAEEVNSSLRGLDGCNETAGWFALLRYDQMERFASALVKGCEGDVAQDAKGVATEVLTEYSEELLELDWRVQARSSNGVGDPGNRGVGGQAAGTSGEGRETAQPKLPDLVRDIVAAQRPHHGASRVVILDDEAARLVAAELAETVESGHFRVPKEHRGDFAEWLADLGCRVDASGKVSRSSDRR